MLGLLSLCAAPDGSRAQFVAPQTMESPRTIALASSSIADARDALDINPAIPSAADRLVASFVPAPAGLERSWSAAASGLWAVDSLNAVGVGCSQFVYQDIYSSDAIGILYSRSFLVSTGRAATAGLRLHYRAMNFGEHYLPLTELSMDAGVTFDLAPRVRAAAAVTHLASLYTNQDAGGAGRTAYLGLSYRPIDELTVDAAAESPQGDATSVHAGIEYMLDPHIIVRAGTETAVGLISGGVGLRYSAMQLDFAVEHHPDLGSSLCFGIAYAL